MAASVQTKQPKEAERLLVGCWKLLCKTIMFGMCMEALPEQDLIEISAVASFAPGGERSGTGVE
eukprot:9928359-Prorocentrum_lima.AAC.1